MSLSGIGFLIEEAAKNIRRNGLMSLAALTTVALSLAILGAALLFLYNLDRFVTVQSRQFEVEAFVEGPRESALAAQTRIQSMPGVAQVRLFTKEQAWAEWQQADHQNGTGITEEVEENPFPDRLDIRFADPRKTTEVATVLRDPTRFPEIHKVVDDHETLQSVLATERLVRTVGGVAAILLCLATAFMIQNTLRLTVLARKREIRIMQLVGATAAFIRFPLILEGIFYGVAGAAVAGGLVIFAAAQLSTYIRHIHTPLAVTMPTTLEPTLVVGLLIGLGGLVGATGSVVSIHRFLKKV